MPVYVYIIPVLCVGLFIWQIIARRRGMAATTHATVGGIAQRLGLQVVEGDAKLNLFYLSQPNRDYRRNIRMDGAPHGRRLRWDFTDGIRHQDFVLLVKRTTTWGCYLVADVHVGFPPFEVVLRRPNEYLVPDRMHHDLPEARTGDPAIDQAYRIAIGDPSWAPALIPAIRALGRQEYVHIVGQGAVVMMPLSRYGLPYFAHAAEQFAHALEVVACTFEGTQPPAPPPSA
jgi:hypothetical protein